MTISAKRIAELQTAIAQKLKAIPEQQLVVGPLVQLLVTKGGWDLDQIIFGKREWQVPKTPSEASKRERGGSFEFFPVDIAVFDDPKNLGDYRHLLFVIECKQPDESSGLQQLETYLSLEPHAQLGVWANSPELSATALFVYKDKKGLHFPKRKLVRDLPSTGGKIHPRSVALCFKDLVVPSNDTLFRTFTDLLDKSVAGDNNVTRGEDQLDQLCNLILLKLESDKKGASAPNDEVDFVQKATDSITAKQIRAKFDHLVSIYPDIFVSRTDRELRFTDHTISRCVAELDKLNLIAVGPDTVSVAFQVLRRAALKQREGQFFTPRTVIEAAVRLMNLTWDDIIIDPACGTGGFLIEAMMEIRRKYQKGDIGSWAQQHLFGIDKDAIAIKLTKAVMRILGDGSAHCVRGDSVLTHTWPSDYKHLMSNHFEDGRFSVVFTNPPFGAPLKISHEQAKKSRLSIVAHHETGNDIELGLAMFNRCHDLLRPGGYLCIVLPETYFFSPSYEFVRKWCESRFEPVGVVNVPMDAFQGFCRAKTNLYVLQKKVPTRASASKSTASSKSRSKLTPRFKENEVFFLNPRTCGVYKNGGPRFKVDADGKRTDKPDNELLEHVVDFVAGKMPPGGYKRPRTSFHLNDLLVPRYHDPRWDRDFDAMLNTIKGEEITIGDLLDEGVLAMRFGHGSPSNDQRVGSIPYIKVSDLRNLRINVNPTNLIPLALAKKHWGAKQSNSGLQGWDLLTPIRASSNIGEFAVLLPGEEQLVLTKEILVLRVVGGKAQGWDPFYLLWALSLSAVRLQWQRVTLMQTNREDVGERYREVRLPMPKSKAWATQVSGAFRDHFRHLAESKQKFVETLTRDKFEYIASAFASVVGDESAEDEAVPLE